MKNKFHLKKTLRMKLIATFLPLLLMPLIIVSIKIYGMSKVTIQKNVSKYSQEYLNQLSDNIEYKISEIIKISAQLSVNTQLIDSMEQYNSSSYDGKSRMSDDINNIFRNTLSVYGNVKGIYVFDSYKNEFYAKKRYTNNNEFWKEEWYKNAKKENGRYKVFVNNGKEKTIGVTRSITDIYSKKSIGVILVELPYILFDKSINSKNNLSGNNGVVYILDENNQSIYSSNEKVLHKDIYKEVLKSSEDGNLVQSIDGKEKFIVYHTSSILDWKFIYISDMNVIMKDMNSIRTTLFSVCVILIIISITLAFSITFYLFKPIKELIKAMKLVEKGDYTVRIEPKTNDEMQYLMLSFNNMTDHIEKLIQSVYYAKLCQKEAQLDMLQQQINPHFLYNTFESLRGLAIVEGNKKIADMVKALSNFMRYNLYRGKSITTVEEEIKHISNYITIQNYRYDEKIQLEIDMKENVSQLKIPKFTLQPLVENAILHGLITKKEKGFIKIIGICTYAHASIIVYDNGVGIKTEEVVQLNRKLQNPIDVKKVENNEKMNIGTLNINERLKLYFGKEYGLVYKSTEGIETIVEVKIPLSDIPDEE